MHLMVCVHKRSYDVLDLIICANSAISGIFTRFYGDRPPNILVDEGKFSIEKGTWFMSADFTDGYGGQPHKDVKGMGYERMKRFFASEANDLGATVKEIAINVSDWNDFVIAIAPSSRKMPTCRHLRLSLMKCDHRASPAIALGSR